MRVVVACSLTLCEASSDYEPTGRALVARYYPHVVVFANSPLDRIEGGALIERPARSTIRPKHHDSVPHGRLHDVLFVANVNQEARKFVGTGGPALWDSCFNYYCAGVGGLSGTDITMIDPGRVGTRSDDSGFIDRTGASVEFLAKSRLGGFWESETKEKVLHVVKIVVKTSGQAAFDGIQIAPPGEIPWATHVEWGPTATPMVASAIGKPADWSVETIVMAPCGGADALNMTWRWSDDEGLPWAWGWDLVGPYRKAGAPMVPPNQTVVVRFMSGSAFLYNATATNVASLDTCFFVHHGGAFVLDDANLAARAWKIDAYDGYVTLMGDNNTPMLTNAGESWVFASWRGRYRAADSRGGAGINPFFIEVRERTLTLDLQKAMDL